jgi:hypothetical protein
MSVLGPVDRLPSEALRAVEAVALARTWPSWWPDYDPQVGYEAALDKAWRQPRASLKALAMAARDAAKTAAWEQAADIVAEVDQAP